MNCNVDPISRRFISKSVKELFWDKIEKTDTCWLWTGACLSGPNNMEYGRAWDGEKEWKAHRWSWFLHNGEIPEGMQILHHCDNPPCVNPSHLFLGDHDANMADKKAKGRNCYGDLNGSRTHPESRPRGERSGRSVITDNKAKELYELYHDFGADQRFLAEKYQISQQSVSQITRAEGRFTWLR